MARFCDNRGHLPKITIERYVNNELDDIQTIEFNDIPIPQKEDNLEVKYSTIKDKKIVKTDKTEVFHIRSFVIPEYKIDGNRLYMVSTGELGNTLPLDNLAEKESIEGKHFMFLLSGNYLDQQDSDDRGNICLMKEQDLKKLFKAIPSKRNGLTLCVASLAESKNNNVYEICDEFAKDGRIHFAHLRNIKFIKEDNSFVETSNESIDGDIDMAQIVDILVKNNFDGYVRADHGRNIFGEKGKPGYGLYDRALGATYINGLFEMAERNKNGN